MGYVSVEARVSGLSPASVSKNCHLALAQSVAPFSFLSNVLIIIKLKNIIVVPRSELHNTAPMFCGRLNARITMVFWWGWSDGSAVKTLLLFQDT